ncbi:STM3941 family protein [Reyranella sp. CPCC 100927]|uniref:STM3941 family protein n=1 Tax=Reyranella sp. CPCC 100927 TaxID=2599616 RepID=UPI0011B73AF3|nr:STM3941 family protein [Reyranella sp. CPCC 100927]TWT03836.1 hypothetical protein FQU96_27835 [Reyranella sp. CPCC 100927]
MKSPWGSDGETWRDDRKSAAVPLPIVVAFRRSRVVTFGVVIVFALAMVALGVFLWIQAAQQTRFNPVIGRIGAAVLIGLFAPLGIALGVQVLKRAPALIIDAEGIVDNTTLVSAGRVPWLDIQRVRATVVGEERFLTLDVADPAKYVRQGNMLRRCFNALNLRIYGSPVHISANALAISFDGLAAIINRLHAQHQATRAGGA